MSDRRNSDALRAGRRAAGRAESPNASVADPALRQLQASLGNDGLRTQLAQGRADRSIMLAHVVDRLAVMQQLQGREASLLVRGANYDWWRSVSKDNSGTTTTPDPNRWHEAAGAYKAATDALCRGDMGRGQQLLEKAMQIEDRTVSAMTSLVNVDDLAFDARPDTQILDGLVGIGQLEACDAPEGTAIADEILRVDANVPDTPEIRRTAVPWWAEEEEEEEVDDGGDDAGGG